MDRIRALDKQTGDFVGEKKADEITEPLRHAFHFACLNKECSKRYHWRTGHSRKENTEEVRSAFVEDSQTEHEEGCAWDFGKHASNGTGATFYDGAFFHLRINFPLGGAWTDINPRRGRLTLEQRRVAEGNTGLVGVKSMAAVVKLLEKEFDSFEAPQLDQLKLHYQGREYLWKDLFAASDDYGAMVDVPEDSGTGNADPRLAVVKILREKSSSPKGKRRFLCEWQQSVVRQKTDKVQPTLVCADNDVADMMAGLAERQSTTLVSARPFVPESFFERAKWQRGSVPVSLYIAKPEQVAEVDEDKYWRYQPLRQSNLNFSNSDRPEQNRA